MQYAFCTIDLNIPIIAISGNHDSPDRLSFLARQLKKTGVYILTDIDEVSVPVKITGKSGRQVNFYGIPYFEADEIINKFDVELSDTIAHGN